MVVGLAPENIRDTTQNISNTSETSLLTLFQQTEIN